MADAQQAGLEGIWEEWVGYRPRRPASQPLLAGGPAAVRVLTELLSDPDERVREAARAMLYRIRFQAAKGGLVDHPHKQWLNPLFSGSPCYACRTACKTGSSNIHWGSAQKLGGW